MSDIKRVLWLSDFGCSTGFATVAQNIVSELLKTKKYQIDVIGINYYGMPNEWQKFYPMIRLLPATVISNGDLFGRQGLLNLLGSGNYDILFTLQDTFQMELIGPKIIETREALKKAGLKDFKWIYYYPIDAPPKQNWITQSVALSDYPVAYTQYGYDETLKKAEVNNLSHIPHGYNPEHFFPMPQNKEREAFKESYFKGKAKGKYIVTNINRNQPRKDLARTLQIFRLFKNQCPDALLYLHAKEQDVGGSIDELARNFDLIPEEDYITPEAFNEHKGVSLEMLNAIYNISDVIMTTTLGEGWGLSMTESMACGTPVIAPSHTSLTEMLTGYGTLVSAGKRLNDWIVLPMDNEILRPIVDVAEFVDKMVYLHNNKEKTKELSDKALKYVSENLTWNKVCEKWLTLFEKATIEIPKQGRNELCKCGSNVKYKNCHGR